MCQLHEKLLENSDIPDANEPKLDDVNCKYWNLPLHEGGLLRVFSRLPC